MADFNKRIEGIWPDVEVPGWMVVHLECGHLTHQPKGNTNKTAHCGVCMLNHQAYNRELNTLQEKIAKAAAAGAEETAQHG